MSEDSPTVEKDKTSGLSDGLVPVETDESQKEMPPAEKQQQQQEEQDEPQESREPPRSVVRYKYSREELLALKCHPLSILRPECFDPSKNKRIAALSVVKDFAGGSGGGSGGGGSTPSSRERAWEPAERERERSWVAEKRGKPESPPAEDPAANIVLGPEKVVRRSGGTADPRERLRRGEQEGIVLSPQRRSFNSGCYVSGSLAMGCGMGPGAAPGAPRRPESPLGGKPDPRDPHPHREIPTTRRIGSGRILRDRDTDRPSGGTWDFERGGGGGGEGRGGERGGRNDKEGDFNAFRGLRDRDRERDRDERFDRRSFGREFDQRGDKERRGAGRGYTNDRRRMNDRDEEPEWFSGGPTSQHDTIELHGFDDTSEEGSRRKKQTPSKPAAKPSPAPAATAGKEGKKGEAAAEKKKPEPKPEPQPVQEERKVEAPKETKGEKEGEPTDNFNLEDFLQLDLKLDQDFSNFADLLGPSVFPPAAAAAEKASKESSQTAGAGGGSSSRFQQWFTRHSPTKSPKEGSRRSSFGDEIMHSIMKDITEQPSVSIPSVGSAEAYFAPISPAAAGSSGPGPAAAAAVVGPGGRAVTGGGPPRAPAGGGGGGQQLMDLLRGGQQDKSVSIKDLEASGRLHSVEELEAKMMQQNLGGGRGARQDEQQAFQKLLMQVSQGPSDSNGASTNQPHNFMQMLSKGGGPVDPRTSGPPPPARPSTVLSPGNGPHEQQGMFGTPGFGNQGGGGGGGGGRGGSSPQMNIPQDLVMKLLQLQQLQQQPPQQQPQQQPPPQQRQQEATKLLGGGGTPQPPRGGGGGQFGSSLPHEVQMLVNQVQPSREMLQRPEAQNIMKGLKQGELTLQHLVHQLHNPGMQPRHRELLACIVKVHQNQQQNQQQQQQQQHSLQQQPLSPRAVSPHPELLHQLMVQQQQQQLRITSPLNGGLPHRVPSPHELVVHAQQIMQTALIKKKLEEQRENFRRRQELHRSHSPNVAGGQKPSSSSPLAFTPTSVLRKMTAEKEAEPGMPEPKPMMASQPPPQLQQHHHHQPQQPQQNPHLTQNMQHSGWKPIEQPNMPKPHQGRPIVKGGFSSAQQQQQPPPTAAPQFYQGEMGGRGGHMGGGMRGAPKLGGAAHHYMNQPPPPQQQQQQQPPMMMHQQNRGGPAPPAGDSGVLLQQLLMGQRSINSYTSSLAQQQQHHPKPIQGRPLRAQQQPGMMGGGGHEMGGPPGGGSLSQWFSGAGQLGSMPPIPTANTLSLEEIERRQQASAVHN